MVLGFSLHPPLWQTTAATLAKKRKERKQRAAPFGAARMLSPWMPYSSFAILPKTEAWTAALV